jgi:hypothetical protein
MIRLKAASYWGVFTFVPRDRQGVIRCNECK